MKLQLLILSMFLAWFYPSGLRADNQKPFELTTLLGETYHRCHLIKATPAALTVSHDSGVSKVSFDLLDDTWREKFHFDPDKAREFEKEEQEKKLVAEERRQRLIKERDKQLNSQMKQLTVAEKQRLLAQEAEEAKRAASTPALAPFPGDPINQVVSRTEIVIPPVSVLGTPYTPNSSNRSQSYILPYDSGVYNGYSGGSGPVYVPQLNPFCPPVQSHQGTVISGLRSYGGAVIRIGP
jgi:hypothetical protein